MTRASVLWSLAVVLALTAAACSGDDDSAAGTKDDPFGNAPGGNVNTNNPFNTPGAGVSSAGSGAVAQEGNPNCPSVVARTGRTIPRVILVLDGSCSMSTPYPANGAMSATRCTDTGGSRWHALRDALVGSQDSVVRRLEAVVEFGLVIFGTQPTCPIPGEPIEPALNNLNAIDGAFPQNTPPGMFTPTGPALDWVYDNLIDTTTGPDAEMRPQIVLLATDGEPNSCDEATTNYDPSIAAVTKGAQYLSAGVRTYVISLADATGPFHDHLQQLADIGVGGQGTLYTPATPDELEAALQSLVGGAVGCDMTLNGSVTAGRECAATVTLNGKALECGDANGWMLTDPTHIRLQGSACDTLKDSGNAVVSVKFPCGTFKVM